ncbi:MAG: nusG [Patescibacteria group bacterium]|nr:nusG [Patescibacteria group bacterium]
MARQDTHQERAWFAIHTYAGYENAVERNLKQRVESLGMQDKIFNVLVPTEKVIKVKNGKRVEVDEKFYPGYILVDMIVTDDSWYVIRNTPRVTGFVGSGTVPVPMRQEEIDAVMARMKIGDTKHNMVVAVGDLVTISEGAFKDQEGKVSEVDAERGKVKVLVSMFGRETPFELDFSQVKKM